MRARRAEVTECDSPHFHKKKAPTGHRFLSTRAPAANRCGLMNNPCSLFVIPFPEARPHGRVQGIERGLGGCGGSTRIRPMSVADPRFHGSVPALWILRTWSGRLPSITQLRTAVPGRAAESGHRGECEEGKKPGRGLRRGGGCGLSGGQTSRAKAREGSGLACGRASGEGRGREGGGGNWGRITRR